MGRGVVLTAGPTVIKLTHNGLPVYTYVNEGPGQVLCDDVDGWSVVRV